MSANWNWPGSRWWRVDLHAHSPASHDYMPEAERLARDWGLWLSAAESANLDAIAVADHNTPEGVDGIQALSGSHMVVFPGLELSVGGIHLLCLLDPTCSHDDLVTLLGQLSILPAHYGATDTTSPKGLGEAMDAVRRLGGVVIAAHANGPKGLLTVLEGGQRKQVLQHQSLSAVELAPMPAGLEGWLDPASPETVRWLDGSNGGRPVSMVYGSDSHQRSDAGRRFTWVKMTRPAIDGLTLALLDGDLSLRPSTDQGSRDPNRHASLAIESITVTKAKFIGKPDPLTISFNPWLNAIIGGRGTGKSSLVDMLRLTLGRAAELGGESDGSLRTVFDNRMRVPPSRQDEGLLTAETVIEVVYRLERERFAITWDLARNESHIARIDGDTRVPEEGAVSERFPVRIYSQKQLFDLAKAPNALLEVIDDTDQVRGDDLRRRQHEAENRYMSLMAEARSLRTGATELGGRRAALADLQRKISLLEQQGNVEVLSEYRLRKEQADLWDETRQRILEAVDGLEAWIPDLEDVGSAQGPGETDPPSQAFADVIAATQTAHRRYAAAVQSAVNAARDSITSIESGPRFLLWRRSLEEAESAYAKLGAELSEAGIANADAYAELLELRTQTMAEIRSYEGKIAQAAAKEKEAAEALEKYRGSLTELSSKRVAFAAASSSDLTRVEIRQQTDVSDCEGFVREALGIERFDEDHAEIIHQILTTRPKGDAWSFTQLDTVVAGLRQFNADERAHWPGVRDRRFEAALRRLKPERIDRLALYAPGDAVEVSFSDPRVGKGQWKRLPLGSPGQQTAALLAFVLGYGKEPIILDQPEDDLDSTLIYDLVVQKLRASKQTRQVIVVTHNSNVVVHGDAELVMSLEAVNGQTRVSCVGGLQEHAVREEVCRVMEGGRDAFDLRYRRIREIGGPSGSRIRQGSQAGARAERGAVRPASAPGLQ